MTELSDQVEVAVVGAGPTGLTVGARLAARGVRSVVLDAAPAGTNESRASVVHAHTLELLEPLGVSAELRAHGVAVPSFSVRDRDRTLLRVDFSRLPTAFPFALMVPQSVTEEVLGRRLVELGGTVVRPHPVTAVGQDAEWARVTVTVDNGSERVVRARYVVGADGMHSVIRDAAAIAFEGFAYPESFLLADVSLDWTLPSTEVALFFSPAGLVVVAPLPHGRHRVVATVADAPEHPDRDDIQRLLDERGPCRRRARVRDVVWGSRFHVHHRLAARYRDRRVILAGDAAHVHSPAGGQGMNTGIADAVSLADRLAEAIGASSDAERNEILDGYERQRRPVAQHVLRLTDRLTRTATIADPRARLLRNTVLSAAGRIPAARRALAMNLSQLSTAGARDGHAAPARLTALDVHRAGR